MRQSSAGAGEQPAWAVLPGAASASRARRGSRLVTRQNAVPIAAVAELLELQQPDEGDAGDGIQPALLEDQGYVWQIGAGDARVVCRVAWP
ncbi:MAG: hypothetical protein U0822_16305 [Anaerolineae bacterium]